MGYRLGVDLGTTFTSAAVYSGGWSSVVGLGNRAVQVPSVLFLTADGNFLVGESAERRGVAEPDRVVREFKRRIGDQVPILVGDERYTAHALMGRLLSWVVDAVAERQGARPDGVVATHPANWGPFKQDLFGQALRLADIELFGTLTEPEAAAVLYASRNRLAEGACIGVYDLGGGTFDAAVLRRVGDGFQMLGVPEGIEQLGGIDFDEAVFQHVIDGVRDEVAHLSVDRADVRVALARLRRDCVEAKEALSTDAEVTVSVVLPGVHTAVRLDRAEFEAMIRPTVADTIGAMHRALRSAGITPAELTSIVLIGGSSRIPLVGQLLTTAFARPLALDTHPKHDVALGAALASDRVLGAALASGRVLDTTSTPTGPDSEIPTGPGPSSDDTEEESEFDAEEESEFDTEDDPVVPRQPDRRSRILIAMAATIAAVVLTIAIINPFNDPQPSANPDPSAVTSAGPTSSEPTTPTASATSPALGLPAGPALAADRIVVLIRTDAGSELVVTSGVDPPVRIFGPVESQMSQPTVSPDRQTIAYLAPDAAVGQSKLRVVATNGQGDREFPTGADPSCAAVRRPAWSTDGELIVASCLTGTERTGLSVFRKDGTFYGKLTEGQSGSPTWADGDRIVFCRASASAELDNCNGLFAVDLLGSTPEELTPDDDADFDDQPDWSPNGDQILFVRSRAEANNVWVMDSNGENQQQLTDVADATWPSWSTTGDAIAYESGGQVWRMTYPDGDPTAIPGLPSEGIRGIAWGTR